MTLSPGARKLALTAHVAASVGWLGAVAAFFALSVVGLGSEDRELVRAIHLAAEPLVWFAIVPLALASLVTGVIQSLGTAWGLLRHYWVVFKLAIGALCTGVLLTYTQTVESFADVAEAGRDPGGLASFVLHSGAGLVLLLAATALAVCKPRGITPYGWRRQRSR